ncbi:MAG: putative Na+/H+ antiporter [Thermodesulfobacteriota bacterium]|nr:putative Na+/H+ antiporter [Thermodesulfobacteriota bacterium]
MVFSDSYEPTRIKSGYALIVLAVTLIILSALTGLCHAAGDNDSSKVDFPPSLESYNDADIHNIGAILKHRIAEEPFNLAATIIFLCAIIHTFLANKFLAVAHHWEAEHARRIEKGLADRRSVHHGAELFHFLGEVEVVFGLWAIALATAIFFFYDWKTVTVYITQRVNYTEAIFVVVIMTLSASRPILKLTEALLQRLAGLLGGTLTAWWFSLLTLGPLLGSLITEPAAMAITALLLGKKFYELGPSSGFKYATIGLLFVNISVGGTLTHFAAPPILMVAGPWDWGLVFMTSSFGWKALVGILISNAVYFLVFRKELTRMQDEFALVSLKDEIQRLYIRRQDLEAELSKMEEIADMELGFTQSLEKSLKTIKERLWLTVQERLKDTELDPSMVKAAFDKRFEEIKLHGLRKHLPGLLPEADQPFFHDPDWDDRDDPVPAWVIIVHVLFMIWTIVNAHYPALFVPGMLFFLGFTQITSPYQNRVDLKTPLLVGFFLGGLVIHGGVQGWWIAPVLGNLSEFSLMATATVLTAFNDNAAITYLCTLIPEFTDTLKYAVVAGAVAGGGLTVIANAPNPAGMSILKRYFENGVSPGGLLKAALIPTIIVWICFAVL